MLIDFCFVVKFQQVIFYAFTQTKSTVELSDALEALRKRHDEKPVIAIYVDNVEQEREFLKNGNDVFQGFGEKVYILHDPFHKLFNISRALPKDHPLGKAFLRELSAALFTVDGEDKKRWEEEIGQKMQDEESFFHSKSDEFAFFRDRCRRHLITVGNEGQKEALVAKIRDICRKYNERIPLVDENVSKQIASLTNAINSDAFGTPPG